MPIAKYKKDKSSNLYYTYEKTGRYGADGKPEYKKLRAKTIAALDKKVKEYREKAAFGVIDDKVTVNQWYQQWYDVYKRDCRPSTKRYYESLYRVHIEPRIGFMRIDIIKEHTLQSIIASVGETHAQKTVKGIKSVLFSLFDTAVTNNLIIKNPAAKLKVTGRPPKKRRPLTKEERNKYLNRCTDDNISRYAAFLYFFGLRKGEALALTRADIYPDHIHVDKQFTYPHSNTPALAPPKTTAGVRDIPIPEKARSFIDFDHLPDGLLFANEDGSPLLYSTVADKWNAFIKSALGEDTDITIHCLRHNYCTMLFENGVDILTVKEYMGHDDVNTTLGIYAHFTDMLRQRNIEKVLKIG